MTDLVAFGEGMLRLTPPGNERLERATEFRCRAAGAESNTAIAAQRMGADSMFMSRLPESPLGHRVERGVLGNGIETEIEWTDRGRQGIYYIEHAGSPRGVNVVYDREGSAFADVSASDFDLDRLASARGFYTTGITPALSESAREATANLLGAAHNAGTTVAFDVNYRSQLWSRDQARETLTQLFPAVDVLVVAARDAKQVLGYSDDDPPQIAHKIAAEHEFTTVAVTRGDRGALVWHDSVVHEHDGYETDTVDPIGAGDAFSGAFIARRLSGDGIRDALDYAAAAASLERTIPGDRALVTREEVEAVIAGELDGISR